MPRTLKIAPVQMDATPAPVAERLERAANCIGQATAQGAQLVVLPEVFNTGYQYSDTNYALAEPINGTTVNWMIAQAAQHNIHLAGSLLLLDDEDIYNAALLVAPDGRLWRYDKHYPWLYERAYFRAGNRITIADTDFGRVGMMICHDYNHAELWERYAGKVDLIVITSCPPRMHDFDMVFPDGFRLPAAAMTGGVNLVYAPGKTPFGEDMNQHAAWMHVPVVNTVASGMFRSGVPQAKAFLGMFLAARPDLWGRISQADEVVIETGFDLETKVVDAAGEVLARVEQPGDGFTLAEITLPDERPAPGYDQPKFNMTPLAMLLSDVIGPALVTPVYRAGTRRQWGAHMAPVDPRTRLWLIVALAAGLVGWFFGRGRRK
jgi:predicted amidohydrolase